MKGKFLKLISQISAFLLNCYVNSQLPPSPTQRLVVPHYLAGQGTCVCGCAGGLWDNQRWFSSWHQKIKPRRRWRASKWRMPSFSLDPKRTSSYSCSSFQRAPSPVLCVSLPCLSSGVRPPLLALSHWAAWPRPLPWALPPHSVIQTLMVTHISRKSFVTPSQKTLLYYEGGQTLGQVAQRCSEVPVSGHIKNLTGHGPGQPSTADPAWAGGLTYMISGGLFQPQHFCNLSTSFLSCIWKISFIWSCLKSFWPRIILYLSTWKFISHFFCSVLYSSSGVLHFWHATWLPERAWFYLHTWRYNCSFPSPHYCWRCWIKSDMMIVFG